MQVGLHVHRAGEVAEFARIECRAGAEFADVARLPGDDFVGVGVSHAAVVEAHVALAVARGRAANLAVFGEDVVDPGQIAPDELSGNGVLRIAGLNDVALVVENDVVRWNGIDGFHAYPGKACLLDHPVQRHQ